MTDTRPFGRGAFLSPKDVKDGEIVEIATDCEVVEFNGQKKLQFEVELGNGDIIKATFNSQSVGNLNEAWGYESSDWVGKKAIIRKRVANIAGEEREFIIFEPATGNGEQQKLDKKDDDIPVVEPKKEGVDVKNVPF